MHLAVYMSVGTIFVVSVVLYVIASLSLAVILMLFVWCSANISAVLSMLYVNILCILSIYLSCSFICVWILFMFVKF